MQRRPRRRRRSRLVNTSIPLARRLMVSTVAAATVAAAVARMAAVEGLEAHRQAVTLRLGIE